MHLFSGGLRANRNPAWIKQALEEAARERQAREQQEQKKKAGGGFGLQCDESVMRPGAAPCRRGRASRARDRGRWTHSRRDPLGGPDPIQGGS